MSRTGGVRRIVLTLEQTQRIPHLQPSRLPGAHNKLARFNRLAQISPTRLPNKPRSRRRKDCRSHDPGARSVLISGRSHARSIAARSHTCLASASSAQRTKAGLWLITANSPTELDHSMVCWDTTGCRAVM
jgi:hypothetical protein